MQQFISGLKSRNEEVRLKAARDLHHYVTIYFDNFSLSFYLSLIIFYFYTGDIRVKRSFARRCCFFC